LNGEEFPFLGEVWSLPWQLERDGDHAIRLVRDGVITPFRIERRVELRPGEASLRLDYTVTNVGTQPFEFIWGLHPGFPIGPSTHIEISGSRTVFAEGHRPVELGDDNEGAWPLSSVTRLGRDPANTWSLLYVTDLHDGRLAVIDDEWRTGLSITFPHELFRCVWVWLVDGGWRGIRCIAVEPWTGYPARLDQASAQGRSLSLNPTEKIEASFVINAFEANTSITGEKGAASEMRLSGKVAAVTGAAGGIGSAVVTRFAEEGAAVACIDRDDRVDTVCKDIQQAGGRAIAVVADVSTDEGNQQAVAATVEA